MSAERERANPDSSKINASPSLLQGDIGSTEQQETTPTRNANMSTLRPEGAQRREPTATRLSASIASILL